MQEPLISSHPSPPLRSRRAIAAPDRAVSTAPHHLDMKPLVSLVAPAYNESAILQRNLTALCEYMRSLEDLYTWEMVVVNDGSKDDTGWLAEEFARSHPEIHVVHHRINQGLGQALKTGFSQCRGDYIVVVDLDLSYSPEHIGRLLERIEQTGASVVAASPYMAGGSIANVPWLRETLSIWANRFLSVAARRSLATLTGMVRAYDTRFIQSLSLRSSGMGINPEIVHKALLLLQRVDEIPGHLHWHTQDSKAPKQRKSSLSSTAKLLHHTWDIIFSGFILRPVMFFILPSLVCLLLSLYTNGWVLVHCWYQYQQLAQQSPFPDPTEAIALAFRHAPHTFFIGGISLMLSIQLLSLGVVSAQNKNYFEELFYLDSAIYRELRNRQD